MIQWSVKVSYTQQNKSLQISKQAVEYHHNLEQRRVEEERLKEKISGLESKLAEYQDKYFCEGIFY